MGGREFTTGGRAAVWGALLLTGAGVVCIGAGHFFGAFLGRVFEFVGLVLLFGGAVHGVRSRRRRVAFTVSAPGLFDSGLGQLIPWSDITDVKPGLFRLRLSHRFAKTPLDYHLLEFNEKRAEILGSILEFIEAAEEGAVMGQPVQLAADQPGDLFGPFDLTDVEPEAWDAAPPVIDGEARPGERHAQALEGELEAFVAGTPGSAMQGPAPEAELLQPPAAPAGKKRLAFWLVLAAIAIPSVVDLGTLSSSADGGPTIARLFFYVLLCMAWFFGFQFWAALEGRQSRPEVEAMSGARSPVTLPAAPRTRAPGPTTHTG